MTPVCLAIPDDGRDARLERAMACMVLPLVRRAIAEGRATWHGTGTLRIARREDGSAVRETR